MGFYATAKDEVHAAREADRHARANTKHYKDGTYYPRLMDNGQWVVMHPKGWICQEL